jgi:hypothetical protein
MCDNCKMELSTEEYYYCYTCFENVHKRIEELENKNLELINQIAEKDKQIQSLLVGNGRMISNE